MRSGVPISSSSASARLGAPPCSGPLSAPIAATTARTDVGAGGRDDPGGERGGVEAVVHRRDQVGADRPGVLGRGLAAGEHPQVVGRGVEVVARCDRLEPADRRCSAHRMVGVMAHSEQRSRRSRCAGVMSITGRSPRSAAANDSAVRNPSSGSLVRAIAGSTGSTRRAVIARSGRELGGERLALGLGGGQRAVDHQPHHVVERPALGEVDGRVLAVVVEALAAAHVAHLGVGHHHALQAARHLRRARSTPRASGRAVRPRPRGCRGRSPACADSRARASSPVRSCNEVADVDRVDRRRHHRTTPRPGRRPLLRRAARRARSRCRWPVAFHHHHAADAVVVHPADGCGERLADEWP
jgi:hypothetical protein